MRRLVVAALLVLFSAPCFAQGRADRSIVAKYDLDSASYIYCVTASPTRGPGRVETSGSSATVTAVAGLDDPFTSVVVGDELNFGVGIGTVRTVIARASATSITVDSAVNLDVSGGATFTYARATCGTAATDGWFSVGAGQHTITIVYRQGDLTGGVDFDIETRTRSTIGLPVQILTGNIAATTTLVNGVTADIGETTSEFRVGLKYNTADTSDATTNLEQIDVILSTER